MTISAKLSRKLYETFGDEAAADMVDWMQRVETHRSELRELNELNFSRVDSRFAQLESRMDGLESRMDGLESRMDRLESRMDRLESRMDRLESRMDRLESRMDGLEREMKLRFEQFETTIVSRLEGKIDQRTAELMKWSFVFWVGAVTTLAVVTGLLR